MLQIFMIILKETPVQNMNPNIRIPYCKPYWSDKESNNFGYPLSLAKLGYYGQR